MPVSGEGNWDDDEVVASPSSPYSFDPHSPGPEQLSFAPAETTEPQPVTEAPEKPEPLPEFDPRYRQDFEGLMFLGKLSEEFSWLGHKYVIRTLTSGEVLEIGLLHKPYIGTLAETKAYQALAVAGCVVSVDGRPISIPITNEVNDTEMRNKFEFILRSWFPPVLDKVYEEYLKLEERVIKTLEAMGKAPG